MDWQDIETAPKDGTQVLGFWRGTEGGKVAYGAIHWAHGEWWENGEEVSAPDYWLPISALPKLPETK